MGRLSLPHLVDMDWTIVVKKASSQVQSLSVPALMVQLDIEQTPERVDEPPRVEKVGERLCQFLCHCIALHCIDQIYTFLCLLQ